MTLHPIRAAFERGRQQGRQEAFDHLRAKAALHQGEVGDARRRGALNSAADEIRDGREPARMVEQKPLGWLFAEDGRLADV